MAASARPPLGLFSRSPEYRGPTLRMGDRARLPSRAEPSFARSAMESDLIARQANRIARPRGFRNHAFVERSGSKALQIDRDESKPDLFEFAIDGFAKRRLEHARHLALLELEPRDVAMVAHARDRKTHRMKQLLASRDFFEPGRRYLRAVWKARRQARRRRSIPRRQSHRA